MTDETDVDLELGPDALQDLQRCVQACNDTLAMIAEIISQARHAPSSHA